MTQRHGPVLPVLLGLGLLAVGCMGGIEEHGEEIAAGPVTGPTVAAGSPGPAPGAGPLVPSPAEPPACGGPGRPGPTPLRRLTREEYRNTIADLFGVAAPPEADLPEDARFNGFTTTAGQALTPSSAVKYFEVAGAVAASLVPKLPSLLPCAAQRLDEPACVRQFLQTTGTRIFRRPLARDEVDHFAGVFAAARRVVGFEESAGALLQALLTAPQFLFLLEPDGPDGQPAPLDGWQIAARLSYALVRSTPDAALLEAAAHGELADRARVAAHLQRLLSSAKARPAVAGFFDDWLQLEDIERVQKDTRKYPLATPNTILALAAETRKFLEDVFWRPGGDFARLFVSPVRWRNERLGRYYGDATLAGSTLVAVTGEVGERSFGLLSQAGFLMAIGRSDEEAPIYRGKFVRNTLLCASLPPPPPDVAAPLPKIRPGTTTRQRVEAHTAGAACMGCHGLINPPGFALEHFDGAGLWRDTENGLSIDARAAITGTDIGAVNGALELSRRLGESATAQGCFVARAFEYVFGRPPADGERCLLGALEERFRSRNLVLRDLLADLLLTDAFFVRVSPKE